MTKRLMTGAPMRARPGEIVQARWPLIGRQHELAALVELLGTGRPVVLAGPSGVGKTRLSEEVLHVLSGQGFEAVRLAATASAANLPLGAYAAVLPEVAPEPDRSVMLRRIAQAITTRAAGRQIVLFIDDAHLLDEASAVLTHQLAVTRKLAVLLTVRTEEEVPEPVLTLWKDGLADRIELEPLSDGVTAELLSEVLGGPLSPAAAQQLSERCRGNILFLREMLLAALDSEALEQDSGTWTLRAPASPARLHEQPLVSSRLRELVESRLRVLGHDERQVLDMVALGEPVSVELIEHVAPVVALGDLEHRNFLRIDEQRGDLEVRLAHPVYADVVRAGLTPHRRRNLFRTLADGLETLGVLGGDDLLRVASWRLEGGGEFNPEIMSLASRRAWVLHDHQLAERLAGAAIESGAGFEAEVFRAQLVGLAGRAEEADERLAALGPSARDDFEVSILSTARIDNLCYSLGRLDEALAVAETAERSVTEPGARDVITAYKASVHHLRGQVSDMVAVSEPLLNQASGSALVWACVMAAGGYAHSGQFAEAIAAAKRGKNAHVVLVENLHNVPFAWHSSIHDAGYSLALMLAGRFAEAERTAMAGYAAGLREDSAETRFTIAIPLAATYLGQGRIATAVRYAEENVELAREHGRLMAFRMLSILLAEALSVSGDSTRARAVLDELDAVPTPFVHVWDGEAARARAWLAVSEGDISRAHALLEQGATRARDAGARVAEASLLHDLARLGDPTAGADRLGQLAETIEGNLIAAQSAHARALVHKDAASLLTVSQEFQALGALLYAAEAAADAATVLRMEQSAREANRAERRAQELARRCEGAQTPRLTTAPPVRAALSGRLLEIATLAASGLSNKDIAEKLNLSVRTVENKLYSVYERIGIHNRAELSAALSDENLAP